MKKTTGLLPLFCVMSSPAFVNAQEIAVLNHTFEFDRIPFETQKTEAISGWVNTGNGAIGIEVPLGGGFIYNGFDNLSQAAYLEQGGRISQALNLDLQKGETYTLSYNVGRPLSETGHSVVARIKANGLVLAQKQTHATSLEAGDWTTESITFTATEAMPLGEAVAIEFYNPPSASGSKAHIDNVQLTVAGTGEAQLIVSEKFKDAVVENIVTTDLAINIPEDFDNLQLALNYLDDKIIPANRQITLNVNECGTYYDNPLYINHPQGDQMSIIGQGANCNIVFGSADGIVVTTALKKLAGLNVVGSGKEGGIGIKATDAGALYRVETSQVSSFSAGTSADEKGYAFHSGTVSHSNTKDGFHAELGGGLVMNAIRSHDNIQNGFHANNLGALYSYNNPYLFGNSLNAVLIEDSGYSWTTVHLQIHDSNDIDTESIHMSFLGASSYIYNGYNSSYQAVLRGNYSSLIYTVHHSPSNQNAISNNSYTPDPY